MMKVLCLAVMFGLLTESLCEFPVELIIKYQQMRDDCEAKTKVQHDIIVRGRNGDFVDDHAFKCYLHCLFDSVELIRSDDTIDEEKLLMLIPDTHRENYEHSVRHCGTAEGGDECERAYRTFMCYFEHNEEHFYIL